MNRCYREKVIDPAYLFSDCGTRGAAEFMLEGVYLESDASFPLASRQTYRLRVGAFFDFKGGRIARVPRRQLTALLSPFPVA